MTDFAMTATSPENPGGWRLGPSEAVEGSRPLGRDECKPRPRCPEPGTEQPADQHGTRPAWGPGVRTRKACLSRGPRPSPQNPTHEMASTMASPMRMEQTAWSSR